MYRLRPSRGRVRQGEIRSQCDSLASIFNADGRNRNRHKRYTKNLIALDGFDKIYDLGKMPDLLKMESSWGHLLAI